MHWLLRQRQRWRKHSRTHSSPLVCIHQTHCERRSYLSVSKERREMYTAQFAGRTDSVCHTQTHTYTHTYIHKRKNVRKRQRTLNSHHAMRSISLQLLCVLITICSSYYFLNEILFIQIHMNWPIRWSSLSHANATKYFWTNFSIQVFLSSHTTNHIRPSTAQIFNLNSDRLTFHWRTAPEIRWKQTHSTAAAVTETEWSHLCDNVMSLAPKFINWKLTKTPK